MSMSQEMNPLPNRGRTRLFRVLAIILATVLFLASALIIVFEVIPNRFVFDHSFKAAIATLMLSGYFAFVYFRSRRTGTC